MAIFTLISASLAAAGFTGAVTIFGLSPALSAAVIAVGKAVLWGQVSKALQPGVPAQQVQAAIAQAAGSRVRGYGQYLLGGVRVLREAKAGRLYQIIAAHHGPISEVLHFEVDGEAVGVDGAGAVTSGSASGFMVLKAITSGDGGDYVEARTAFPTIWTTDHKLTGQASIYCAMRAPKLSRLSQVYPRQAETAVAMVARLSPVVDPRTGILGYSDLTGPAAYDYLTHVDGYRIPVAAIDTASFAAFTEVCDENVSLRAGGVEKRYRVGGYYTLEDAPKDVMTRILATADAQLYMTAEGKAGVLGGRWQDPDVTIGADDILALTLTDGFDEFTDFNVLKGKFTSAKHRYQEAEPDELVDTVALETQPQRVDTHVVDMCPSHAQMRRLMYLYRARKIRRWTGSLRTNLVGMKARFPRGNGPHVIRIIFPELPIDGVFEVLTHSYSVPDKKCEITIASLDNAYPWDADSQEGDAPPPLDFLNTPTNAVPVPEGLTLSQEVVALSASQNAVRIVAVVGDPDRPSLQLQAQYRRVGDAVWQPMVSGVGDLRAYSGTVADSHVYEVRAAWVGFDAYSDIETITAVSNPVAPAVATSFAAITVSGLDVPLHWTNGTTGFYRSRVYRSDTSSFATAELVETVAGLAGQPSAYTDNPGAGTWYYWIVSINASLIEAAPTGPQSATV